MENLKFKSFEIAETKADESGNLFISGYGAIFGNVDSYGDVIEKGAFEKTLTERAGRIAFCYQHDIWNPIGKIEKIGEDEKGLFVNVKISAAEKDIQTKIKEGILKEMSIGYQSIQSERREMGMQNEVNFLKEIKLIEVSLVTVAANPLAVIEKMKSEEKTDYITKEFDRILAIVRNEAINYEIQKLKSLVLSAAPAQEPQEVTQPQPELKIDKNELLTALNCA
jgi:HK97 family phage prohead protease